MNIYLNLKYERLNDLCNQVFDYLHLVYYDLESKIDNELNINGIKNKFETFADKHFKSAIKEFENEIQYLKNKSPKELMNLEKISSEMYQYFDQLIKYKLFNCETIEKLKIKAKENLSKIQSFNYFSFFLR